MMKLFMIGRMRPSDRFSDAKSCINMLHVGSDTASGRLSLQGMRPPPYQNDARAFKNEGTTP